MAKAIKVKLDTLYAVDIASEKLPAHYTPATIEIFSAGSAVTIRATTNPDFSGTYSDLPEVCNDAAQGDVFETEVTRSVRFVSFSCSDSTAEIYVSGFSMTEVQ